jgi:hypothetical protein
MTSTRIRPWLFNESLSVSYIDNFPPEAREIPLASDMFIEQEHEVIKNLGCDPDSCIDGVCPWDIKETQSEEQIEVDRWLRRFGPLRGQPQTPPQQPRPGPTPQQPSPKQPSPLDSQPDNPWNSPTPSEPSEPVEPEYDGKDDSNPWAGPRRILPRPEDKPPVQPKPEPLSDASKIDLIYDSLKNRVEPTLGKIDTKLTSVEESNRDSRGLLGRLRDRLDSPSPQVPGQPPIDPKNFSDRISDGIFARTIDFISNLPIIKQLRFFLQIAFWVAVFFVVDWLAVRWYGSNWLFALVMKLISVVSNFLSSVWKIISDLFLSIRESFSRPTTKQEQPVSQDKDFQDMMAKFKEFQEFLKNQPPKE